MEKRKLSSRLDHIFSLCLCFFWNSRVRLTERNIPVYCDFAVRHLGRGEPVLEKAVFDGYVMTFDGNPPC